MAGDLNVNQLTVATTVVDADKLYYGKSPFGVTDDRAISYLNFKTQINITDTYSGLNTTDKTIVGALNEAYQWDRALLSGSVYYLTPRHSGDVLKLKNYIYLGTVDPYSRTQIWNYELNSVLRLGALTSDGDPINATSEGSIFYGQNAQGDAISSTDFSYVRLKPNRIGLYNAKSGVYTGYLFLARTETNEFYLKTNAGVKTLDFDRETGILTLSGLSLAGGIVQTSAAGVLSTSVTLPNGTLAITQAAGDNSTKLATTAYVDAAVLVENLWDRISAGSGFYHLTPHNSGTDIVKVTVFGNQSTANYNIISEQSFNGPSMANTGNGILFTQYYSDLVTPATEGSNEGYIGFFTEGNWTSTASTQDSYFILKTVQDGVLVDALKITSDKSAEFYNKITLATTGIPGINSQLGILSYYNGVQANYYSGTLATFNAALQLTHVANGASMTNTENGIFFNQYYYDVSTPAQAREGFIGFGTEGNWTSTTSTQSSFFKIRTVYQNNWVDALAISSSALGTLYGIWSYNSHPTFTSDTQLVDKKYVDDLAGAQTPITEELTITSNGQTSFTLSHTPHTVAYVNLYLNGQRRRYSVDFTVSGTTLTWNDPGGLTLQTTDSPLIVTYEY